MGTEEQEKGQEANMGASHPIEEVNLDYFDIGKRIKEVSLVEFGRILGPDTKYYKYVALTEEYELGKFKEGLYIQNRKTGKVLIVPSESVKGLASILMRDMKRLLNEDKEEETPEVKKGPGE